MKKHGCSILFFNGRNEILLFLRDDNADIPFPNKWDLLGGHVNENETPEECIVREMKEELNMELSDFAKFSEIEFPDHIEHTFYKEGNIDISKIDLNEGQKLEWFSLEKLDKTEIAFGFNIIITKFFEIVINNENPQMPFLYKDKIALQNEERSQYLNILLAEYNQAFDNYKYRDKLIPNEFNLVIFLTGVIISILEFSGDKFSILSFSILFLIGFFALYILFIDIMSNSSSKKTSIKRVKEIEKYIEENFKYGEYSLEIARILGIKKVHFLEKITSKFFTSSTAIIWFVGILIVIWIIYGYIKISSNL